MLPHLLWMARKSGSPNLMCLFDSDILNWKQFWVVAVHDRKNLSDAEKLVYAVKKGTARGAIEGLFQSGDHYSEAIGCLKSR